MPSSACKKSARSEEHTSELQSHDNLVCRLLLEKKPHSSAPPCPLVPANPLRLSAPPPPRREPALSAPGWHALRVAGGGCASSFFFFLKNPPPPDPPPLPHTPPFRA